MGKISTIYNPPDTATQLKSGRPEHPPDSVLSASKDATQQAPEDATQFTKLSSVLNGLKRGATAMRAQVTQAMSAVRSGDYHVDPLQVSRSIVLDSLAWRR